MIGWEMFRGSERILGQSFEDELDTGDSLTGTPTVEVRERTGSGESDWTDQTSAFTVTNPQVMSSDTEDSKGHTIPAGQGILFQLLAPDDAGTFVVRMECASDAGPDPLVVERSLRIHGSPDTVA